MKLPVLIAIPHGKTDFPENVRKQLTLADQQIQESYWDYGSDELFTHNNFHIVTAPYSRLFCDLNRASDDWTISDDLKRAGVVRQKTELGKEIYKTPLSDFKKEQRIMHHNEFYARCLQVIKNENIKFFIAGHTMEDFSSDKNPELQNKRPDIVISTNNFQTCDEETAILLSKTFQSQGLSVQIDDPFLGGHLLTHFCSVRKLPGVQIEVRRGLFATNAHEINVEKLQAVSKKIEQSVSIFWKKFLAKGER